MGVATCAGSTCHGATQPFAGVKIRQDEYFIWQSRDAHARAYQTLLSDRSASITRNLGWKPPAEEPRCLVCHTDDAKPEQRGPRYLLGDGVGCEACHGAAERWLGPHVHGFASTQARRRSGMYPTDDMQARAQLCLGCHQGDEAHPMTHAIMGAGHPPLLFELDTFMLEMPPHHGLDADYRARKQVRDDVSTWAIGQVVAADLFLKRLMAENTGVGVFPELALFDCNACHHSLLSLRWEPGRAGHLGPGSVRLADTSLSLVGVWLDAADKKLASRWKEQLASLQDATATGQSAMQTAAADMHKTLESKVMRQVQEQTLSAGQLRDLLAQVVRSGQGVQAGDYSKAEQTAMAVSVLCTALAAQGKLEGGAPLKDAVEAVYSAVENRDRFEPARYKSALEEIARLLAAAKG